MLFLTTGKFCPCFFEVYIVLQRWFEDTAMCIRLSCSFLGFIKRRVRFGFANIILKGKSALPKTFPKTPTLITAGGDLNDNIDFLQQCHHSRHS